MKKKLSSKELETLEQEMREDSQWEEADHVVVYRGPTSVRFRPDLLKKLQALAQAKNKTVSRLVNDYVRAFVEEEYQLLAGLKRGRV